MIKMERKNLYIGIIILAIVGVGAGFGIGYGVGTILNQPSKEGAQILLFYGPGIGPDDYDFYTMSMQDLKSSEYIQVKEQLFYTLLSNGSIELMGSYTGVSLRSILEKGAFLKPGAENYTGIGWDGFAPGFKWDMLNISNILNKPYNLCIIAYGGTSFDPLDIYPRFMINQSIVAPTIPTIRASRYCISNLTTIYIE
jgi:hypothetical protein